MSGRWEGESATEGQATVEVALILPLVVLLVMLTVQVGVVARNEVLVVHAAREAARAAAVSDDDLSGAANRAAAAAGPLVKARMRVVVQMTGSEQVTVEVSYDDPTDVPLIGPLVPTVRHHATATMQHEPGGNGGGTP